MKLTLLLTLSTLAAFAAQPLTNADIVRMVQQGIAPAAITAAIQSAPETEFRIAENEQPALRQAGVPDAIIQAMVQRRMYSDPRSNYRSSDKPETPKPAETLARSAAPDIAPDAVRVETTHTATLGLNRSFDGVALVGEKGMTHGKLLLGGRDIEFPGVRIPLDSVHSLTYERSAKPRIGAAVLVAWPLIFTKSKKHFLTVQYEGGYNVFQLSKGNYMQVLAAMEAATGKHVERHEER